MINAIFVVEMVIKITACGRPFFRDPWNWFDLVVITAGGAAAQLAGRS